jgi:NAD(P)-dependent dehydrogenase (short-subunit alcohol dehydrogenase family)
MSGATALKPAPGMFAVAATNAAVDAITAGLAVELAPIRVNAIAPGTIDTGAYDALGAERKAALFQARSAARRAGNNRWPRSASRVRPCTGPTSSTCSPARCWPVS